MDQHAQTNSAENADEEESGPGLRRWALVVTLIVAALGAVGFSCLYLPDSFDDPGAFKLVIFGGALVACFVLAGLAFIPIGVTLGIILVRRKSERDQGVGLIVLLIQLVVALVLVVVFGRLGWLP